MSRYDGTSPGHLSQEILPDSFLACFDCAKAKAKCEKKFPCARCVRRKIQCRPRLTQRGPGRSSGSSTRKKSTQSANSKSPDTKRSTKAKSHSISSIPDPLPLPQDSVNNSCFELDCNNGPYIDPFSTSLSENASHDVNNLNDLSSYINSDISKGTQDLRVCLDTFMHQSFFEMTNIDDFAATNDNSMSSRSQSSYAISPELLQFTSDTPFPVSDATSSESASVKTSDSADGAFPALEAWPIFQCNTIVSSNACPTTAKSHLRNMYAALGNQKSLDNVRLTDQIAPIEPLQASTRDRLIAILQGFSTRTQKLHGLTGSMDENSMLEPTAPNFLILPPPTVLESLLHSCLGSYEPYYPFLSAASLNPNQLMEKGINAIISSLKLLLMLAAGAMTSGAGDIDQISYGLLEICRVSLSYLIEEDVKLVSNPDVLQCALLYTLVAAWSGDKWQMDTAIYQKAMYMEMLSKAKFLDHQNSHFPLGSTDERMWQIWKEQELVNRMAYSWVILDQEMCLFQDSPSTLFASVTDLNAPVPSPDAAWQATSSDHWAQELSQSGASKSISPSLNEYVRRFREIEYVNNLTDLSPTILRLLLCHLQNLVSQVRISIANISPEGSTFKAVRHTSMVLVSVHLDEARDLLQKWYILAKNNTTEEASATTCAAMILYHLIVLNTLVSFPEVERLARDEASAQPSRWKRAHHFEDTQHIYFHCGQVLRIIRSIPEHKRPSWWAGALYRVALISWANSMSCAEADFPQSDLGKKSQVVVLDTLAPEDSRIESYLNNQNGVPMFSEDSGVTVSLEVPGQILLHCAKSLGLDPRTKLIKGIRQKLLSMAERWEDKI